MGVQKERKSTFLTGFKHREEEARSLFAAQYWYCSCLWIGDGTGQHICSPARPEVGLTKNRPAQTVNAKPQIIFRPGPARNIP